MASSEKQAFPSAPPASPSPKGDGEQKGTTPGNVWPKGLLPSSHIRTSTPDHSGPTGFNSMCDALYRNATNHSTGTSTTFDINVRRGQIGWYTTRSGTLHTLTTGRHWKKPTSRDSEYTIASLADDELHLPPVSASNPKSSFHVIRVNPGEIVAIERSGVGHFLTPDNSQDRPYPGYYVFENDRTLEVKARIDTNSNRYIANADASWIIKVPPGQACKAFIGSKPILLFEGAHHINHASFRVANSAADLNSAFISATTATISHGMLHLIQVPPGFVLPVEYQGKQHLLGARQIASAEELHDKNIDLEAMQSPDNPLYYQVNSAQFRLSGEPIPIANRIIEHGTIKVVRPNKGEVARLWQGDTAIMLPAREQPYIYNSALVRLASHDDARPEYRYDPIASLGANVLRHGTECHITVPAGSVFLGYIRGHALMLGARNLMAGIEDEELEATLSAIDPAELFSEEAGHYIIKDPTFKLVNEADAGAPYHKNIHDARDDIIHGNLRILKTKAGQVSVVKKVDGEFQCFGAGYTIVQAPRQILLRKLPNNQQQRMLKLKTMSVQTRDSHKLQVNAMLSYRISDPTLAAQQENLEHMLERECHTALSMGITSTQLNEMGQDNVLTRLKDAEKVGAEESKSSGAATSAQTAADSQEPPEGQSHRAFSMAKQALIDNFEAIGVELVGVSIQDWEPLNEEVRNGLEAANLAALEAERAVITARAEAQKLHAEAEGRAKAAIAEANAAASVKQAASTQQQEALLNEARTRVQIARLNADAITIEAEAKAAAIEAEGRAQAAALRAKNEALSTMPAQQVALDMQAALAQLFQGVNMNISSSEVGPMMQTLLGMSGLFTQARQSAMQTGPATAMASMGLMSRPAPPSSSASSPTASGSAAATASGSVPSRKSATRQ